MKMQIWVRIKKRMTVLAGRLRSESAIGLVEAVVARAIVGILSASLLGLLARVVRTTKRNELQDTATQLTVEGLEAVRSYRDDNTTVFLSTTEGSNNRTYRLTYAAVNPPDTTKKWSLVADTSDKTTWAVDNTSFYRYVVVSDLNQSPEGRAVTVYVGCLAGKCENIQSQMITYLYDLR